MSVAMKYSLPTLVWRPVSDMNHVRAEIAPGWEVEIVWRPDNGPDLAWSLLVVEDDGVHVTCLGGYPTRNDAERAAAIFSVYPLTARVQL